MRAVAIGRRDSVEGARLAAAKQARGLRQRGMQVKEAVALDGVGVEEQAGQTCQNGVPSGGKIASPPAAPR